MWLLATALVDCLFTSFENRDTGYVLFSSLTDSLAPFAGCSALIARDDNGPLFHSALRCGVEQGRPSVRRPHTLAIVCATAIQARKEDRIG